LSREQLARPKLVGDDDDGGDVWSAMARIVH
jgi:hypothetical protein